MPLDIATRPVQFEEQLNAIVNRINRRGLPVKIRASEFTQPLGRITDSANEFQKSIEASNARVIAFGASAAIIGTVGKAFEQMVVQAVKVEKILTDINVVLDTSAANLERFGNQLFDVARNTAQSLDVAAEAALEFSRQGLTMEETLSRTNDALILTRLTGMKAADAVKGLTAAVNSYADAGVSTTDIINKLAAVDVQFAVSADDLVNALSRAGAVAQDAGLSMDQLVGAVTAAQQITARGGAVIGNSFKTIFTRLQRSSTLERLEELGIAVRDVSGQTLPAVRILTDLAKTYDTLGDSTKAAVAEQVGGVFQINVLKASLKDLTNENSLFAKATKISGDATDEAARKNATLNQSLAALAAQTSLTMQELASNIGELALAPGIEELLEKIKSVGDSLNNLFSDDSSGLGSDFAKGIVSGIGNVITGPGMVLAIGVFGKLFFNALKFAKQSLKDVLGIVTQKDKERKIQESIVQAMQQNAVLADELVKSSVDRQKQEQIVLGVIKKQTEQIELQKRIAAGLAPALSKAGVQGDLTLAENKAEGFVPNFNRRPTKIEKNKERTEALRGGYSAGNVKVMSVPGYGEVVYNQAEKIKKFKGMDQPAIMPPQSSKAGKAYQKNFSEAHGFNPYAASGLVPNFADNTPKHLKIQRALADPANKNIKFKPKNNDSFISASIRRQFLEEYDTSAIRPGAIEEIVSGLLRSYKSGKTGYGVGGKAPSRNLTYQGIEISRHQVENPGTLGNEVPLPKFSDGFVPNFAIQKNDNLLKLDPAFSSVAGSGADFRNRTLAKQWDQAIDNGSGMYLEAPIKDIVPNRGSHNAYVYDLLTALQTKGIDRIGRIFYPQKQARTASKKPKRGEDKGSISERAKIDQLHKVASGDKSKAAKQLFTSGGNIQGMLDVNPRTGKKILPEMFSKYLSTGGADGDDTFPTDVFGPGLRPIENKSGRMSQGNLLLKSIRNYSDSGLLHWVSKTYPDLGNIVSSANQQNFSKARKLLEKKGLLSKDSSLEEAQELALASNIAQGFVPNFVRPKGVSKESQFSSKKSLDLSWISPAPGKGTQQLRSIYTDITSSAEQGKPYTDINAGFVVGPRIPRLLIEGKKLLNRSRTSGKKIPKMRISGFITPAKLMGYINENKQRFEEGDPYTSRQDYKQGEESEVAQYLRAMGLDPLSKEQFDLEDLPVFEKGFAKGLIPNFANKIYDSDRLKSNISTKILDNILEANVQKNLIIGPSGVGKSTMAQSMGEFIKAPEDLEKASLFTILSGAGLSKDGLSPRLQKIIQSVNSSGGKVSYLSASDETIEKRREKRMANPIRGDLRSERQLKGTKYAPKNQEGLTDLLKSQAARFQVLNASKGFVPNFAGKVKWNIDKTKNDFSLSADKMTLSGFANYLEQVSEKYPKMVSPKAAQMFQQRVFGLDSQIKKEKEEVNQKTPIGFGRQGAKHYAEMRSVSNRDRKISTQGLFIKDLGKHVKQYNKHSIFGADRIDGFDSMFKGKGFVPNFVNYSNIFDSPQGQSYVNKFNPTSIQKATPTKIKKGKVLPLKHTISEINATKGGRPMTSQKMHPVDQQDQFSGRIVTLHQEKNYETFKKEAESLTESLVRDQSFKSNPPGDVNYNNSWINQSKKADPSMLKKISTGVRNYQTDPKKNNQNYKAGISKDVMAVMGELETARLTGGSIATKNAFFDVETQEGPVEVKTTSNQPGIDILRKGANLWLSKKYNKPKQPLLNKRNEDRDLGDLKVMVPEGANVFAKGFVPNYLRSNVAGLEFAKLSTSVARFNRKNNITPPIKTLSSRELFKIPRRSGDLAEETIQNIRQYISSDEFRALPQELQLKITKFYNKKFARSSLSDPGRSFTKYEDPTYEGRIAASMGLVPNFVDPLSQAVRREQAAGVPKSQMRIEKDPELINQKNPLGLAVTNLRDEPLGIKQGIRRAKLEGKDPKTYGASAGIIPNYADGSGAGASSSNLNADKVSSSYAKVASTMDNMQMRLFGLTTATYAMQGVFEESGSSIMASFNELVQGLTNTALVMSALGPLLDNVQKKFANVGNTITDFGRRISGQSVLGRGTESSGGSTFINTGGTTGSKQSPKLNPADSETRKKFGVDKIRNRNAVSAGGAFAKMQGVVGGLIGSFGKFSKGIGAVTQIVGKTVGLFGRFLPLVGWGITLFQGLNAVLGLFDTSIGKLTQGFTEMIGLTSATANSLDELKMSSEGLAKYQQTQQEISSIEQQIEDIYAKPQGQLSNQDFDRINTLSMQLAKAQENSANALNEFANSLNDTINRLSNEENPTDLEQNTLNLAREAQRGTLDQDSMQNLQRNIQILEFNVKALSKMEEEATDGIDFGMGGNRRGVVKEGQRVGLSLAQQAGRLNIEDSQFDKLSEALSGTDAETSMLNFAGELENMVEPEDGSSSSLDEATKNAATMLIDQVDHLVDSMQENGYTFGEMNTQLKASMESIRNQIKSNKANEKEIEASQLVRSQFNKALQNTLNITTAEFKHKDNMLKKELGIMSQRMQLLNQLNQATKNEIAEIGKRETLQRLDIDESTQTRQANATGFNIISSQKIDDLFTGSVNDTQTELIGDAMVKLQRDVLSGGKNFKEAIKGFKDTVKSINDQLDKTGGDKLEIDKNILQQIKLAGEVNQSSLKNIGESFDLQRSATSMQAAIKKLDASQVAIARDISGGLSNYNKLDSSAVSSVTKELREIVVNQGNVTESRAESMDFTGLAGTILSDGTSAMAKLLEDQLRNVLKAKVGQENFEKYEKLDLDTKRAVLELVSSSAVQSGKLGTTRTESSIKIVNQKIEDISKEIDSIGDLPGDVKDFSQNQINYYNAIKALGAKRQEQESQNLRIAIAETVGKTESMTIDQSLDLVRKKRADAELEATSTTLQMLSQTKVVGEALRTRAAINVAAANNSQKDLEATSIINSFISSNVNSYEDIARALELRLDVFSQGTSEEKELVSNISQINNSLAQEFQDRQQSINDLKIQALLRKEGIVGTESILTGVDLEKLAIEESIQLKKKEIDKTRDILRNVEAIRSETIIQSQADTLNSSLTSTKSKILLDYIASSEGLVETQKQIQNELENQVSLNQTETIRLREQLNERRKRPGEGDDSLGVQETKSLILKRIAEEKLSLEKSKEERSLIAEKVAEKIVSLDLETSKTQLESDILKSMNETKGLTGEESVLRKSLNEAIKARVENEIQQLERSAQDAEDTYRERQSQGFFAAEAGSNQRNEIVNRATSVSRAGAQRDQYSLSGNELRASQANVQLAKELKEFNIEAGKNTLFWDTINVKIAEATERASRFSETLAVTAFDGVRDGFAGLFKDLSDGSASVGDSFLKMAAGIASKIQEKIFEDAADRMTAGIFSALGINKFHTGGMVTNYASGGSTKSDVPAMLTAGEYVVRKKAVDSIGRQAMDRINKGESLQDIFEKPNSETFDILGGDMQMMGQNQNSSISPLATPILSGNQADKILPSQNVTLSESDANAVSGERIEERLKEINNNFKEGGSVKISKMMEKVFSKESFKQKEDQVPLQFYRNGSYVEGISQYRSKDKNFEDIGYGVGFMGGTAIAAYNSGKKDSGPKPPEPPRMNKLNTSSTLDLDIKDPRLSARFRKMDTTSQDYAKYLLDKYEYNVQKQNKKVAEKAEFISSIGNAIALGIGAAVGSKIGDSISSRINASRMSGSGMSVGKGPSGKVVKIHRDKNGSMYAMEGDKKVNFMDSGGASSHLNKFKQDNNITGDKLSSRDAAKWWQSYSSSGRPGFAEKFQSVNAGNSSALQKDQQIRTILQNPARSAEQTALESTQKRTKTIVDSLMEANVPSNQWKEIFKHNNVPYPPIGYNAGGSVTNSSSANESTINKSIHSELNRIYNQAIVPQSSPQKFNIGGAVIVNNATEKFKGGMIKKYSEGGFVKGPAGIDKVGPVMLDDGEYVIKASSVQKMERENPGMLERLNNSRGFAEGGLVSNSQTSSVNNTNLENSTSTNSSNTSSNNVTVNINVGGGFTGSADSVQTQGNATENQTAMAGKLKAAVLQVIAEEQRVGGMLRGN